MTSEAELDELLSRPAPEDVDFARQIGGDVLVLGAGGKMGPSLVGRIQRSLREAGSGSRVLAVSRFRSEAARRAIEDAGAAVIEAELLEEGALDRLPDCPEVVYMAGTKFGTSEAASYTWAMNAYLPGRVAGRFRSSRIAAFSTGNVYPLVPPASGGATEDTAPGPIGEYAQSCLGRERVLEHFSREHGTRMVILRLNYAVEARYGVLLDLAERIMKGEPVPLATGHVNVIWQGDACSMAFRSLAIASSPPRVLNVTGKEVLSVRALAGELARRLGREAVLEGTEAATALISDASLSRRLLGPPRMPLEAVLDLVAGWVLGGGRTLGKPTHFEVRDGRF